MARRDRESLDPEHAGLFADAGDAELFFDDGDDPLDADASDAPGTRAAPDAVRPRPSPSGAQGSRSQRHDRSRDRRRRRVLSIVAVLAVAIIAVAVAFVGLPVYRYLFPSDYDGNGTGTVVITVRANDGAAQIGATLTRAGVVGSERAFSDAAAANSKSQSIQPGSYALHRQMSAAAALTLLLDPASRVNSDTVVTEGATIVDVEKRLIAPPCSPGTKASVCGIGVSEAEAKKALSDVAGLGVPTDYLVNGRTPVSVEGFLYPATYTFDDQTTPTDALQQMVGTFTDQARAMGFSAKAKAAGLTPYDALIIASVAQAEAKFPEDFAKVARVILNRLKINRNLQVDATSAYAAKLKGLDPTKEIYAQTKGPFNSYSNAGLPPTPIGNPGKEAMLGAVNASPGPWLYYVNKDAAGHLGFYTDEATFIQAQKTCAAQGWGCAAP